MSGSDPVVVKRNRSLTQVLPVQLPDPHLQDVKALSFDFGSQYNQNQSQGRLSWVVVVEI